MLLFLKFKEERQSEVSFGLFKLLRPFMKVTINRLASSNLTQSVLWTELAEKLKKWPGGINLAMEAPTLNGVKLLAVG